jgi:predicted enzyme related to lactoylglutathione lyase
MAKVLGVGGIFFKSPDPRRLLDWYCRWLGFPAPETGDGAVMFFPKAMPENALTVWSPFPADTAYFAPSDRLFMFNLIVDDLDEALKQVAAGGAQVVGGIEQYDYGRFGWFIDPDGNKVELWQP